MIKIGGVWEKTAQDSGKKYFSASIAKELLPLTITEEHFMTMHLNENKTDEKHPDYHLCLSLSEKKEKTTINS